MCSAVAVLFRAQEQMAVKPEWIVDGMDEAVLKETVPANFSGTSILSHLLQTIYKSGIRSMRKYADLTELGRNPRCEL